MLKYSNLVKYAMTDDDKDTFMDEYDPEEDNRVTWANACMSLARILSSRKHPKGWKSLRLNWKPYKDGSEDIDAWYDMRGKKVPADMSEEDLDAFDAGPAQAYRNFGVRELSAKLSPDGTVALNPKYA